MKLDPLAPSPIVPMAAISAKSNAFMASTSFASAKRQAPVQRGSLQVRFYVSELPCLLHARGDCLWWSNRLIQNQRRNNALGG